MVGQKLTKIQPRTILNSNFKSKEAADNLVQVLLLITLRIGNSVYLKVRGKITLMKKKKLRLIQIKKESKRLKKTNYKPKVKSQMANISLLILTHTVSKTRSSQLTTRHNFQTAIKSGESVASLLSLMKILKYCSYLYLRVNVR